MAQNHFANTKIRFPNAEIQNCRNERDGMQYFDCNRNTEQKSSSTIVNFSFESKFEAKVNMMKHQIQERGSQKLIRSCQLKMTLKGGLTC